MSKLINISWEKYKTCIFVFISLWYIYQFWSMILKKYITNKKCTIFLKYTLWRFTNTKWKLFTHKRNIYRCCHHFLGMNVWGQIFHESYFICIFMILAAVQWTIPKPGISMHFTYHHDHHHMKPGCYTEMGEAGYHPRCVLAWLEESGVPEGCDQPLGQRGIAKSKPRHLPNSFDQLKASYIILCNVK